MPQESSRILPIRPAGTLLPSGIKTPPGLTLSGLRRVHAGHAGRYKTTGANPENGLNMMSHFNIPGQQQ